MSTTILLEIYRTRAEALAGVVAAWAAQQEEATRALDLDDVARECLEYPALMRRLNDRIFDRIKARGEFAPAALARHGEVYRDIFDIYLRLLRDVQDRVRAAGTLIAATAALDDAVREMERLRREIFDAWPFFRPEDGAAARAEIERGEFTEVAGELSGSHS